MATLQSGKCFTVPTFFGMCCRSEWQERMYIYKWHEVDQTKHEIFCVHIVCNEIQVKVNLEITTFFFYLRFPYCPNFFWFGVVQRRELVGPGPRPLMLGRVFLLDIRDCIKEWLVLCSCCPSLSPSLLIGPWDVEYVCCFVSLYFGYYVMLCVKKEKKIVDNKKKSCPMYHQHKSKHFA